MPLAQALCSFMMFAVLIQLPVLPVQTLYVEPCYATPLKEASKNIAAVPSLSSPIHQACHGTGRMAMLLWNDMAQLVHTCSWIHLAIPKGLSSGTLHPKYLKHRLLTQTHYVLLLWCFWTSKQGNKPSISNACASAWYTHYIHLVCVEPSRASTRPLWHHVDLTAAICRKNMWSHNRWQPRQHNVLKFSRVCSSILLGCFTCLQNWFAPPCWKPTAPGSRFPPSLSLRSRVDARLGCCYETLASARDLTMRTKPETGDT